jgi:hypothetical protein
VTRVLTGWGRGRTFKHGTSECYSNGCRRDECRAAHLDRIHVERHARRVARVELEQRLAARLRRAIYHREDWLFADVPVGEKRWANEVERTIRRLERGSPIVKKAMEAA